MFQNLDIFRMSHAMAVHAATRQTAIAQNIANADTPGFRPVGVTPFSELVARSDHSAPRATRAAHLFGQTQADRPTIEQRDNAGANPNGNGVVLEEEMMSAVNVKRDHDEALAIYRSSLSILRSSLGRR